METLYASVQYILIALMVITFGVLIVGVVAMGNKNSSPAFRNKIMRVRVGVQALAVVILLGLMAVGYLQSGG